MISYHDPKPLHDGEAHEIAARAHDAGMGSEFHWLQRAMATANTVRSVMGAFSAASWRLDDAMHRLRVARAEGPKEDELPALIAVLDAYQETERFMDRMLKTREIDPQ